LSVQLASEFTNRYALLGPIVTEKSKVFLNSYSDNILSQLNGLQQIDKISGYHTYTVQYWRIDYKVPERFFVWME